MYSSMRPGNFAGAFEDQRLCSVEGGKVGGAADLFCDFDRENCMGMSERPAGLCRDMRAFRVSQINPVAADFVHQRRPLTIGTGAIRHRVDESAGIDEDLGLQRGKALRFVPTVGEALEKYRNIIVGIGMGLTARA